MKAAERLENLYKLLVGASLAFAFCYYAWGIENADDAMMIVGLGWVACFFWSRNLRNKDSAANG